MCQNNGHDKEIIKKIIKIARGNKRRRDKY